MSEATAEIALIHRWTHLQEMAVGVHLKLKCSGRHYFVYPDRPDASHILAAETLHEIEGFLLGVVYARKSWVAGTQEQLGCAPALPVTE